ncbi:hypothetical protein [Streptomyces sp. 351MFTsu5.1]|uniref:hypothetical protein n=1 Tax=Streptomyces sp. 351MFTsu5.1 TaxID=1172180 RepID=UPI000375BF58|nr:hypothetical protein [Streptomyces sp. 351MFTsu5.1]
MYDLPEPPATTGQAPNPLADAVIQAAIDNAIHEARRTGTAPPAPRPERPAMSQKATDDSVRMIAFGGMSLMVCTGGGIVMIASDFADPTVIGVSLGGLAALTLAIARLIRRAGEAAPTEIHQTYTGPVHHDTRITQTRAVWSKTTNRH